MVIALVHSQALGNWNSMIRQILILIKSIVIHQEGVSNDIGDNNKKDNSTENKKFIACLKVSGEGNFPAVWSFFLIYQCTPYIFLYKNISCLYQASTL